MQHYHIREGDKFFFIDGEFDMNNICPENAFTVEQIVELNDNGIIYSDGGRLTADDWDKVWVLREDGIVKQLKQLKQQES